MYLSLSSLVLPHPRWALVPPLAFHQAALPSATLRGDPDAVLAALSTTVSFVREPRGLPRALCPGRPLGRSTATASARGEPAWTMV